MYKRLLICTSLLALGACGGGGPTDGGPTDPFANLPKVGPGEEFPKEGGFEADTTTVQTTFNADGSINPFTGPHAGVSAVSAEANDGDDEGGMVRLATRDGVVEVNFEEVDFDNDDHVDSLLDGSLIAITDADGSTFITYDESEIAGSNFAEFGAWAQLPSRDADPVAGTVVSYGVVGAPTAATNVPTSGSATYQGKSIGGVSAPNTPFALTTSDVTITTPDFREVTFRSGNTRADFPGQSGSERVEDLDFVTTGTISGNGFTADGDGMTTNGNFYGPNGEEVGGTFRGDRGQSGVNYGGSFGAAKVDPR